MNSEDLYLYVFARTDMDTMGRGRACAQVAHAANQFVFDNYIVPMSNQTILDKVAHRSIELWMTSTKKGFGTQIVKAIESEEALRNVISIAKENNFIADLVFDPEYAVPDGSTFHMVPNVLTCGYIFGDKNILKPYIGEIPLLSNDPTPQ